jgi:hypothetical protein
LVKKTLHRHRVGFKPQRASSYRKWVKAPKKLGEAARARTMTPFFMLPCTLLVVLASSTESDNIFA